VSDPHELSLHVLGEHFFGVDGDEDAAAAGEDFVIFVQDFGGVDVGTSALFDFAAFDTEGFVERNGLEIFDGHFAGESDDVVEFVDLAHGVVEDTGDDASVAVAGRSGIAFAEAEFADEGLTGFVKNEFEAHAIRIILAADEAVIFLQLEVAGVVALRLRWHAKILKDDVELFAPMGWDCLSAERERVWSFKEKSPLLAKEARSGAPGNKLSATKFNLIFPLIFL
jgi:hypothetical protein